MINKECYVGEIGINNHGTRMKIVKVRNKSDIDIQFLDKNEYVKEHVQYKAFSLGQVKNPYDITVYGAGYLGVGKHKVSVDKIIANEYAAWASMIKRCYSEGSAYMNKSYFRKATVCDEWHDYQNFGDWYDDNYIECEGRLHLDKDILHPGNKVYSPENCLLIPQSLNALFINVPNKTGLPNGVRKTSSEKFSSSYNGKHLGIFNTIEEAYIVHTKEKKNDIIKRMEEIKDILPEKVINAIYSFEFKLENDQNYNPIVEYKEEVND